ncbi:hypothetical protein MSAN_01369200 [Mycena sanguinolenta]|uniref:Uncharacterized protein n=1 Tax=Mycena sanguinolenta TaxID=230812 RepID=A0A8H6Y9Z6_9AGAR|nr:hypothetical protein MSAN_01369200 [Mycena sanguinolenta]
MQPGHCTPSRAPALITETSRSQPALMLGGPSARMGRVFGGSRHPRTAPQDPKATGYIKPDDYLESPFIIKVLLLILRKEEFILPTELDPVTNKYDFSNMPSGLLAMAAAGVERALRLYIETGVRPEKLPKFSKSSSGTSVTSYLKNIRRFTRSRWECMLAACGAQTYMAPSPAPFAFDAYRDFIYTPSSP